MNVLLCCLNGGGGNERAEREDEEEPLHTSLAGRSGGGGGGPETWMKTSDLFRLMEVLCLSSQFKEKSRPLRQQATISMAPSLFPSWLRLCCLFVPPPSLQPVFDPLSSCRRLPHPLPAHRLRRGDPHLLPGDRSGPVHEGRQHQRLEHRSALQRYFRDPAAQSCARAPPRAQAMMAARTHTSASPLNQWQ